MLRFIQTRKRTDLLLAFICLVAGSAVIFAHINYGGPSIDEIYQSLCVKRNLEAPLGALSFWMAAQWSEIFGFSLVNLRILAAFETICAILISTGYLYKLTENLRLSTVVFLLCCILMRMGTPGIFDWDSGSYIFDSLLLCLLFSIVTKFSYYKCIFIGIVVSCISLGRLPSLVLLPVSLTFIISLHYNKSNYLNVKKTIYGCFVILAAWLITSFLLLWIIYGNVSSFINSLANGNIITGHNPVSDIHYLWGRFAIIMLNLPNILFFGTGCVLLATIVTELNKRVAYIICFCWIVFCTLMTYWRSFDYTGFMFDQGIDVPLGFWLLSIVPIYKLFQRNFTLSFNQKTKLLICLLLLIGISFGSDLFYLKMTCGFTIPLIIAVLWRHKDRYLHCFTKAIVVISLLTFGSMYACFFVMTQIDHAKYETYHIYPFNGLKTNDKLVREAIEANEAIVTLRKNNIPFVYLGNARLIELVYGQNQGLSFHNFHQTLTNWQDWQLYKSSFINKADAIVFNKDNIDSEIINDAHNEGFKYSLKSGTFTILLRDSTKLISTYDGAAH